MMAKFIEIRVWCVNVKQSRCDAHILGAGVADITVEYGEEKKIHASTTHTNTFSPPCDYCLWRLLPHHTPLQINIMLHYFTLL